VLADAGTLADAADDILRTVCELTDRDVGMLWLVDGSPARLGCIASWTAAELVDSAFVRACQDARLGPDEGLPGRAWSRGELVQCVGTVDDSDAQRAAAITADGLHAGCAVPLVAQRDVLGVLELYGRSDARVEADDLEVIRGIGRQLGLFILRKRIKDALRRESERLMEAQHIAHLGSWEWDPIADRITWSTELCGIFAIDADQAPRRAADFFALIHPDDRAEVGRMVEAGTRVGTTISAEYRIVRPDGEVRVVHARGKTTCDAAGVPIRIFGTIQDVTERKRIEAKLVLNDRMASIGTLAAGVAHEINNPLAYITWNLEMLDEKLRASPQLGEVRKMVTEAREGAERVRRIVRELKTFSRPDDERRVLLDVRRVLETSVNMCFNEIRHRARLVKDFGEPVLVEADEDRLGQVFVNLLVNAAQALPDGQADRNEIRVIACRADDGRALVEIHDTGPGIPTDIVGKIFDPFFTTKAIGSGTGLGLSICHGIITDLGGEIVVDSLPGRGCVFRVYLPPPPERDAIAAPATPVAPVAPAALSAAAAPKRTVGKVLVVDDDPGVGASIRRVLDGHDVTVVRSGHEALARLRLEPRFDVILCDLMMPEMTGMDLHREVARAWPGLTERMVFLTGGAFVQDARVFLDTVANERLEKPFDMHTLRAVVQRYVDAAQSKPIV
jgi:PAS domain S-box-containing protein